MEEKKKRKKRSHGEGSIVTVTRNSKDYYKGCVVIGISPDGKAIRKHFGSYKKSVIIEKMRNMKYEAKNNMLSSNPDISFGNLFLTWIKQYKVNDVQNNTFDGYLTCYKLRIAPYRISNLKVSELTLNDLQDHFNALQKDNSPNSIKKIYTKINSCLNFAEMRGIISKNFCKGVILQKIQKKKDEEYKVFSREEQNLIIQKLDMDDVLDKLIYFTFYTGLRLGEALAVRWEKIDGNMYDVREQYQRDTVFLADGKKKTIYVFKDLLKTPYSVREIPLPNKILEFLNTIDKTNSLVFCDENGNPIERKKPDRRVKKICRELRIDDTRTFHSIRHTYATRLFESGIPIKTVQVLMGHADIQTTMNIYTHVMKEKKLEVLSILENI